MTDFLLIITERIATNYETHRPEAVLIPPPPPPPGVGSHDKLPVETSAVARPWVAEFKARVKGSEG